MREKTLEKVRKTRITHENREREQNATKEIEDFLDIQSRKCKEAKVDKHRQDEAEFNASGQKTYADTTDGSMAPPQNKSKQNFPEKPTNTEHQG